MGSEPTAAGFRDLEALLAGDVETRSVERRRIEAAFDRIRDRDIGLTGE